MDPIELTEQFSSSDEETRRSVVASLADLPLEQTKQVLLSALGDTSWRVRKEAVEALLAAPLTEDLIEDLVSLLRSPDNAGLRNSAVELLCRVSEAAVPTLSRHLQDPDQDVRKFIVDILGEIGATGSLPQLIEALQDPDQNVCAAAIENIGKIGDPFGQPYLVACLQKPDIMLRFTALEALARIGIPVPLHDLLPLARDSFLRKAVFDCLGSERDLEAVPVLVEGLSQSRSIKESAVSALARIRSHLTRDSDRDHMDAQLAELRGGNVVEGLIDALSTADQQVKKSIIEILEVIADDRAAAAVLKEGASGPFSRQCIAVFANLAKRGYPHLISAFPAASQAERRFIAYTCGELKVENCTEILWQGMRDGDPELRAIAVVAAGKIGQGMLIDQVVALLEDRVPEVRDSAATAMSSLAEACHDILMDLASKHAASTLPEKRRLAASLYSVLHDVDKLSMLVKDEDVTVRRSAVVALSTAGTEAGINHLVMALADETPEVRVAAAKSLGDRGGEDVVDPLIVALKDEDLWVQAEALKSLGKGRHCRAWSPVAALATCGEAPVIIAALECAVAMDAVKAVPLLQNALDNEDEEVVKAAIELLSQTGEEWIGEYRDRLLNHPHWDVRRSFVRALAMVSGSKARHDLEEALSREADGLVRRLLQELLERMK